MSHTSAFVQSVGNVPNINHVNCMWNWRDSDQTPSPRCKNSVWSTLRTYFSLKHIRNCLLRHLSQWDICHLRFCQMPIDVWDIFTAWFQLFGINVERFDKCLPFGKMKKLGQMVLSHYSYNIVGESVFIWDYNVLHLNKWWKLKMISNSFDSRVKRVNYNQFSYMCIYKYKPTTPYLILTPRYNDFEKYFE